MTWSKVKKGARKPMGWWYHKVMCEIGWALRWKINSGYAIYFHHTRILDEKYGINLYGESTRSCTN